MEIDPEVNTIQYAFIHCKLNEIKFRSRQKIHNSLASFNSSLMIFLEQKSIHNVQCIIKALLFRVKGSILWNK